MSYCVECGVRLDETLLICPLCHTRVINPNRPDQEGIDNPYPEKIEEVINRMDRGYARQLSLIAALIPMMTVLIINIIFGGGPWSLYVIGAVALAWCFFAFPLLFPSKRPYIAISLDVIAVCAYLALIAALTGGFSWYLSLVLPLLVLGGVIAMMMLLFYRRVEIPRLHRAAFMTGLVAVFLMGMESIIDLSLWGRISLGWSVGAGIPFAVTALTLALIQRNTPLKEEIRKRLFI